MIGLEPLPWAETTCHPWMLQRNAGSQLCPRVLKQKMEADRGVSPRATGEGIPLPTAPTAARTPASMHVLIRLVTPLPCPRSPHPQAARNNRAFCRLFLPPFLRCAGVGRPAMPTHHRCQVGQSSRTLGSSPADYPWPLLPSLGDRKEPAARVCTPRCCHAFPVVAPR